MASSSAPAEAEEERLLESAGWNGSFSAPSSEEGGRVLSFQTQVCPSSLEGELRSERALVSQDGGALAERMPLRSEARAEPSQSDSPPAGRERSVCLPADEVFSPYILLSRVRALGLLSRAGEFIVLDGAWHVLRGYRRGLLAARRCESPPRQTPEREGGFASPKRQEGGDEEAASAAAVVGGGAGSANPVCLKGAKALLHSHATFLLGRLLVQGFATLGPAAVRSPSRARQGEVLDGTSKKEDAAAGPAVFGDVPLGRWIPRLCNAETQEIAAGSSRRSEACSATALPWTRWLLPSSLGEELSPRNADGAAAERAFSPVWGEDLSGSSVPGGGAESDSQQSPSQSESPASAGGLATAGLRQALPVEGRDGLSGEELQTLPPSDSVPPQQPREDAGGPRQTQGQGPLDAAASLARERRLLSSAEKRSSSEAFSEEAENKTAGEVPLPPGLLSVGKRLKRFFRESWAGIDGSGDWHEAACIFSEDRHWAFLDGRAAEVDSFSLAEGEETEDSSFPPPGVLAEMAEGDWIHERPVGADVLLERMKTLQAVLRGSRPSVFGGGALNSSSWQRPFFGSGSAGLQRAVKLVKTRAMATLAEAQRSLFLIGRRAFRGEVELPTAEREIQSLGKVLLQAVDALVFAALHSGSLEGLLEALEVIVRLVEELRRLPETLDDGVASEASRVGVVNALLEKALRETRHVCRSLELVELIALTVVPDFIRSPHARWGEGGEEAAPSLEEAEADVCLSTPLPSGGASCFQLLVKPGTHMRCVEGLFILEVLVGPSRPASSSGKYRVDDFAVVCSLEASSETLAVWTQATTTEGDQDGKHSAKRVSVFKVCGARHFTVEVLLDRSGWRETLLSKAEARVRESALESAVSVESFCANSNAAAKALSNLTEAPFEEVVVFVDGKKVCSSLLPQRPYFPDMVSEGSAVFCRTCTGVNTSVESVGFPRFSAAFIEELRERQLLSSRVQDLASRGFSLDGVATALGEALHRMALRAWAGHASATGSIDASRSLAHILVDQADKQRVTQAVLSGLESLRRAIAKSEAAIRRPPPFGCLSFSLPSEARRLEAERKAPPTRHFLGAAKELGIWQREVWLAVALLELLGAVLVFRHIREVSDFGQLMEMLLFFLETSAPVPAASFGKEASLSEAEAPATESLLPAAFDLEGAAWLLHKAVYSVLSVPVRGFLQGLVMRSPPECLQRLLLILASPRVHEAALAAKCLEQMESDLPARVIVQKLLREASEAPFLGDEDFEAFGERPRRGAETFGAARRGLHCLLTSTLVFSQPQEEQESRRRTTSLLRLSRRGRRRWVFQGGLVKNAVDFEKLCSQGLSKRDLREACASLNLLADSGFWGFLKHLLKIAECQTRRDLGLLEAVGGNASSRENGGRFPSEENRGSSITPSLAVLASPVSLQDSILQDDEASFRSRDGCRCCQLHRPGLWLSLRRRLLHSREELHDATDALESRAAMHELSPHRNSAARETSLAGAVVALLVKKVCGKWTRTVFRTASPHLTHPSFFSRQPHPRNASGGDGFAERGFGLLGISFNSESDGVRRERARSALVCLEESLRQVLRCGSAVLGSMIEALSLENGLANFVALPGSQQSAAVCASFFRFDGGALGEGQVLRGSAVRMALGEATPPLGSDCALLQGAVLQPLVYLAVLLAEVCPAEGEESSASGAVSNLPSSETAETGISVLLVLLRLWPSLLQLAVKALLFVREITRVSGEDLQSGELHPQVAVCLGLLSMASRFLHCLANAGRVIGSAVATSTGASEKASAAELQTALPTKKPSSLLPRSVLRAARYVGARDSSGDELSEVETALRASVLVLLEVEHRQTRGGVHVSEVAVPAPIGDFLAETSTAAMTAPEGDTKTGDPAEFGWRAASAARPRSEPSSLVSKLLAGERTPDLGPAFAPFHPKVARVQFAVSAVLCHVLAIPEEKGEGDSAAETQQQQPRLHGSLRAAAAAIAREAAVCLLREWQRRNAAADGHGVGGEDAHQSDGPCPPSPLSSAAEEKSASSNREAQVASVLERCSWVIAVCPAGFLAGSAFSTEHRSRSLCSRLLLKASVARRKVVGAVAETERPRRRAASCCSASLSRRRRLFEEGENALVSNRTPTQRGQTNAAAGAGVFWTQRGGLSFVEEKLAASLRGTSDSALASQSSVQLAGRWASFAEGSAGQSRAREGQGGVKQLLTDAAAVPSSLALCRRLSKSAKFAGASGRRRSQTSRRASEAEKASCQGGIRRPSRSGGEENSQDRLGQRPDPSGTADAESEVASLVEFLLWGETLSTCRRILRAEQVSAVLRYVVLRSMKTLAVAGLGGESPSEESAAAVSQRGKAKWVNEGGPLSGASFRASTSSSAAAAANGVASSFKGEASSGGDGVTSKGRSGGCMLREGSFSFGEGRALVAGQGSSSSVRLRRGSSRVLAEGAEAATDAFFGISRPSSFCFPSGSPDAGGVEAAHTSVTRGAVCAEASTLDEFRFASVEREASSDGVYLHTSRMASSASGGLCVFGEGTSASLLLHPLETDPTAVAAGGQSWTASAAGQPLMLEVMLGSADEEGGSGCSPDGGLVSSMTLAARRRPSNASTRSSGLLVLRMLHTLCVRVLNAKPAVEEVFSGGDDLLLREEPSSPSAREGRCLAGEGGLLRGERVGSDCLESVFWEWQPLAEAQHQAMSEVVGLVLHWHLRRNMPAMAAMVQAPDSRLLTVNPADASWIDAVLRFITLHVCLKTRPLNRTSFVVPFLRQLLVLSHPLLTNLATGHNALEAGVQEGFRSGRLASLNGDEGRESRVASSASAGLSSSSFSRMASANLGSLWLPWSESAGEAAGAEGASAVSLVGEDGPSGPAARGQRNLIALSNAVTSVVLTCADSWRWICDHPLKQKKFAVADQQTVNGLTLTVYIQRVSNAAQFVPPLKTLRSVKVLASSSNSCSSESQPCTDEGGERLFLSPPCLLSLTGEHALEPDGKAEAIADVRLQIEDSLQQQPPASSQALQGYKPEMRLRLPGGGRLSLWTKRGVVVRGLPPARRWPTGAAPSEEAPCEFEAKFGEYSEASRQVQESAWRAVQACLWFLLVGRGSTPGALDESAEDYCDPPRELGTRLDGARKWFCAESRSRGSSLSNAHAEPVGQGGEQHPHGGVALEALETVFRIVKRLVDQIQFTRRLGDRAVRVERSLSEELRQLSWNSRRESRGEVGEEGGEAQGALSRATSSGVPSPLDCGSLAEVLLDRILDVLLKCAEKSPTAAGLVLRTFVRGEASVASQIEEVLVSVSVKTNLYRLLTECIRQAPAGGGLAALHCPHAGNASHRAGATAVAKTPCSDCVKAASRVSAGGGRTASLSWRPRLAPALQPLSLGCVLFWAEPLVEFSPRGGSSSEEASAGAANVASEDAGRSESQTGSRDVEGAAAASGMASSAAGGVRRALFEAGSSQRFSEGVGSSDSLAAVLEPAVQAVEVSSAGGALTAPSVGVGGDEEESAGEALSHEELLRRLPRSAVFACSAPSRNFRAEVLGRTLSVQQASHLGGVAVCRVPLTFPALALQNGEASDLLSFRLWTAGRFGVTVAPAECVFASVEELFNRNDVVGFRTRSCPPFWAEVFATTVTYEVGDFLGVRFFVDTAADGQRSLHTELHVAGESINSVLEVAFDQPAQMEQARRMNLVFVFQDSMTVVYDGPDFTLSYVDPELHALAQQQPSCDDAAVQEAEEAEGEKGSAQTRHWKRFQPLFLQSVKLYQAIVLAPASPASHVMAGERLAALGLLCESIEGAVEAVRLLEGVLTWEDGWVGDGTISEATATRPSESRRAQPQHCTTSAAGGNRVNLTEDEAFLAAWSGEGSSSSSHPPPIRQSVSFSEKPPTPPPRQASSGRTPAAGKYSEAVRVCRKALAAMAVLSCAVSGEGDLRNLFPQKSRKKSTRDKRAPGSSDPSGRQPKVGVKEKGFDLPWLVGTSSLEESVLKALSFAECQGLLKALARLLTSSSLREVFFSLAHQGRLCATTGRSRVIQGLFVALCLKGVLAAALVARRMLAHRPEGACFLDKSLRGYMIKLFAMFEVYCFVASGLSPDLVFGRGDSEGAAAASTDAPSRGVSSELNAREMALLEGRDARAEPFVSRQSLPSRSVGGEWREAQEGNSDEAEASELSVPGEDSRREASSEFSLDFTAELCGFPPELFSTLPEPSPVFPATPLLSAADAPRVWRRLFYANAFWHRRTQEGGGTFSAQWHLLTPIQHENAMYMRGRVGRRVFAVEGAASFWSTRTAQRLSDSPLTWSMSRDALHLVCALVALWPSLVVDRLKRDVVQDGAAEDLTPPNLSEESLLGLFRVCAYFICRERDDNQPDYCQPFRRLFGAPLSRKRAAQIDGYSAVADPLYGWQRAFYGILYCVEFGESATTAETAERRRLASRVLRLLETELLFHLVGSVGQLLSNKQRLKTDERFCPLSPSVFVAHWLMDGFLRHPLSPGVLRRALVSPLTFSSLFALLINGQNVPHVLGLDAARLTQWRLASLEGSSATCRSGRGVPPSSGVWNRSSFARYVGAEVLAGARLKAGGGCTIAEALGVSGVTASPEFQRFLQTYFDAVCFLGASLVDDLDATKGWTAGTVDCFSSSVLQLPHGRYRANSSLLAHYLANACASLMKADHLSVLRCLPLLRASVVRDLAEYLLVSEAAAASTAFDRWHLEEKALPPALAQSDDAEGESSVSQILSDGAESTWNFQQQRSRGRPNGGTMPPHIISDVHPLDIPVSFSARLSTLGRVGLLEAAPGVMLQLDVAAYREECAAVVSNGDTSLSSSETSSIAPRDSVADKKRCCRVAVGLDADLNWLVAESRVSAPSLGWKLPPPAAANADVQSLLLRPLSSVFVDSEVLSENRLLVPDLRAAALSGQRGAVYAFASSSLRCGASSACCVFSLVVNEVAGDLPRVRMRGVCASPFGRMFFGVVGGREGIAEVRNGSWDCETECALLHLWTGRLVSSTGADCRGDQWIREGELLPHRRGEAAVLGGPERERAVTVVVTLYAVGRHVLWFCGKALIAVQAVPPCWSEVLPVFVVSAKKRMFGESLYAPSASEELKGEGEASSAAAAFAASAVLSSQINPPICIRNRKAFYAFLPPPVEAAAVGEPCLVESEDSASSQETTFAASDPQLDGRGGTRQPRWTFALLPGRVRSGIALRMPLPVKSVYDGRAWRWLRIPRDFPTSPSREEFLPRADVCQRQVQRECSFVGEGRATLSEIPRLEANETAQVPPSPQPELLSHRRLLRSLQTHQQLHHESPSHFFSADFEASCATPRNADDQASPRNSSIRALPQSGMAGFLSLSVTPNLEVASSEGTEREAFPASPPSPMPAPSLVERVSLGSECFSAESLMRRVEDRGRTMASLAEGAASTDPVSLPELRQPNLPETLRHLKDWTSALPFVARFKAGRGRCAVGVVWGCCRWLWISSGELVCPRDLPLPCLVRKEVEKPGSNRFAAVRGWREVVISRNVAAYECGDVLEIEFQPAMPALLFWRNGLYEFGIHLDSFYSWSRRRGAGRKTEGVSSLGLLDAAHVDRHRVSVSGNASVPGGPSAAASAEREALLYSPNRRGGILSAPQSSRVEGGEATAALLLQAIKERREDWLSAFFERHPHFFREHEEAAYPGAATFAFLQQRLGQKPLTTTSMGLEANSAPADAALFGANAHETALSLAIKRGFADIVKLLIEVGGCDPTASVDAEGRTPLMVAAATGQDFIVAQLVVVYRVDVDARDHRGVSALHLVAQRYVGMLPAEAATSVIPREATASLPDLLATARLLLVLGAKPSLRDSKQETAIEVARKNSVRPESGDSLMQLIFRFLRSAFSKDGTQRPLGAARETAASCAQGAHAADSLQSQRWAGFLAGCTFAVGSAEAFSAGDGPESVLPRVLSVQVDGEEIRFSSTEASSPLRTREKAVLPQASNQQAQQQQHQRWMLSEASCSFTSLGKTGGTAATPGDRRGVFALPWRRHGPVVPPPCVFFESTKSLRKYGELKLKTRSQEASLCNAFRARGKGPLATPLFPGGKSESAVVSPSVFTASPLWVENNAGRRATAQRTRRFGVSWCEVRTFLQQLASFFVLHEGAGDTSSSSGASSASGVGPGGWVEAELTMTRFAATAAGKLVHSVAAVDGLPRLKKAFLDVVQHVAQIHARRFLTGVSTSAVQSPSPTSGVSSGSLVAPPPVLPIPSPVLVPASAEARGTAAAFEEGTSALLSREPGCPVGSNSDGSSHSLGGWPAEGEEEGLRGISACLSTLVIAIHNAASAEDLAELLLPIEATVSGIHCGGQQQRRSEEGDSQQQQTPATEWRDIEGLRSWRRRVSARLGLSVEFGVRGGLQWFPDVGFYPGETLVDVNYATQIAAAESLAQSGRRPAGREAVMNVKTLVCADDLVVDTALRVWPIALDLRLRRLSDVFSKVDAAMLSNSTSSATVRELERVAALIWRSDESKEELLTKLALNKTASLWSREALSPREAVDEAVSVKQAVKNLLQEVLAVIPTSATDASVLGVRLLHVRLKVLNRFNTGACIAVPLVGSVFNVPKLPLDHFGLLTAPPARAFLDGWPLKGGGAVGAGSDKKGAFWGEVATTTENGSSPDSETGLSRLNPQSRIVLQVGPSDLPVEGSVYLFSQPLLVKATLSLLWKQVEDVQLPPRSSGSAGAELPPVRVDRGLAATSRRLENSLWGQASSQLLSPLVKPERLRRRPGERPFLVVFHGEGATDFGGPFQEFLTGVAREVMGELAEGAADRLLPNLGACVPCRNAALSVGPHQDTVVLCPVAEAQRPADPLVALSLLDGNFEGGTFEASGKDGETTAEGGQPIESPLGEEATSLERPLNFPRLFTVPAETLWQPEPSAREALPTTDTGTSRRLAAERRGGGGRWTSFDEWLRSEGRRAAEHPQNSTASSRSVTVPSGAATSLQGEAALALAPADEGAGISPAEESLLLQMYECLGRLMAMCFCIGSALNVNINPLFWKKLVGEPLSVEDLADSDCVSIEMLRSLRQMAQVPPALWHSEMADSLADVAFCLEDSRGRSVELVPGGRELPVCRSNLAAFLQLASRGRLLEGREATEAVLRGVSSVLPLGRIRLLFSWRVFEHSVCGDRTVDLELLKERSVFSSETLKTQLLGILEDFTNEQLQRFLRFVCGRSRLPTRGSDWRMHVDYEAPGDAATDSRLPTSATCGFRLLMPRYSSSAVMRDRLLYAISNCTAIDLDAHAVHEQMQFEEE